MHKGGNKILNSLNRDEDEDTYSLNDSSDMEAEFINTKNKRNDIADKQVDEFSDQLFGPLTSQAINSGDPALE
jgi:hypothetical protein